MAAKVFDFECPQYVDFEEELDNSGKDDVFFDSKDKSAENGNLCTPEVREKGKGLTESDENRLLSKMSAALSLFTPKLKKSASRGKLFPESVFKNDRSKVTKFIVKPNTVPAQHPRSRRSKSLDHLDKIISGKMNKKKKDRLRKSSSLNDIRTLNKMKYPVTPMCLKRTIFKAKKKVCKTTEEMELEKIARLQKQLIQHLRENEMSLKKLNLRPRQGAASKILPKSDHLKDIKGTGIPAEKSNAVENESRRNIRLLSHASVKKEALKLNTIIHCETVSNVKTVKAVCPRKSKVDPVSAVKVHLPNHAAERKEASKLDTTLKNQAASSRNTIYSRKTKAFSVPAAVSDVISTTQKTKKLTHKKMLDHSGIMFVPSLKSNITVKPFFYDEKSKEKSQIACAKQKETSAFNLKENFDKENAGCNRPQLSSKKSQNAKCDINKLDEPQKITGKRTANSLRSVPLAENVVRN